MHDSPPALVPSTHVHGIRHGLDADHLAAINSMSCHDAVAGRAWRGMSAHSLLPAIARSCTLPGCGCRWHAARNSRLHPDQIEPEAIMSIVGAFFALSFDTVRHAALMCGAARKLDGCAETMLLTAVFVVFMCAVDAFNGIWTACLVHRSISYGRVASRILAGGVGVLSLLIAAYGSATQLVAATDPWSDGKETWLSLGFIESIVAAFGLGKWATRQMPSVIARLDVQH